MNARTERPSRAHEARVATLDTLAVLAGYTIAVDVLPDGGRPDVLRVRREDRSIFVGDGKETETPRTAATSARLDRYICFIDRYASAGGRAMLALAIPDIGVDPYDWLRLIVDLCAPPACSVRDQGIEAIAPGSCAVAWVMIGAR